MNRWLFPLLVAGALLLIICAAGDVFFIHHHVAFFASDTHFSSSLTTDYDDTFVILSCWNYTGGLLFAIFCWLSLGRCHAIIQHFCGWHSSAYLEASVAANTP